MNTESHPTIRSGSQRRRKRAIITMAILFGLFAAPALYAQNSKGDKAASNPILRFPKIKSKSKGGDRANTHDISGRRNVRTKNKSSANHVIYGNRNPASRQKGTRGGGDHAGTTRFKVRVRSVSAKRARQNVYPQRGPYVNNPAVKPQKKPRVYTKTARGKLPVRTIPQDRQKAWTGNLKGGAVGAPSASRPFVTRGRKNVYWGKIKAGGKAVTTDLTGRPVRTKNFHSGGVGVGRTDTSEQIRHTPPKNFGKLRSGFLSISGSGRAWRNDVSGHKIRYRKPGKRGFGSGLFGGFRSASGGGNNQPLPVRKPGIGAGALSKILRRMRGQKEIGGVDVGIGGYRGNISKEDLKPGLQSGGLGYRGDRKTRRPFKGGGSVSGKVFNNNGQSITTRRGGGDPRLGGFQGNLLRQDVDKGYNRNVGGYTGNMRAGRPLKGGGSVSGKFFNNGGQALQHRPPGGNLGMGTFQGNLLRLDVDKRYNRNVQGYSGNMRASRPLKGGGSISGNMFNNDGRPLQHRSPGGNPGIGTFQGNLLHLDVDKRYNRDVRGYTGGLRARRPAKGGGSVSGQFLSNDGKKLDVRRPGRATWGAGAYAGNLRTRKPLKGGGSVSGVMWNNDGKSITAKEPIANSGPNYSGHIRLSRFKKYWVKNPHANDDALKKRKPSATTFSIGGLTTHSRMPDYVKNPSSSDKALKTISPGRAYARMKDYQRNLKMKKFNDKRQHPDGQFAHGNIDNVKHEKSIKTNIKLLWAKLFRKNAAQPQAVTEKPHVPRYDKKEKDLWKALYD